MLCFVIFFCVASSLVLLPYDKQDMLGLQSDEYLSFILFA